jgi:hypothetical protein
MLRLTFYFIVACTLFSIPVSGQTSPEDSAFLSTAKNNTTRQYFNAIKETAPVFQGREFIPYGAQIKGTPFFLNAEPVSGTLEYNGIEYPNIKFAYDMVSDKVIVSNYTNEYLMIAPSEKIMRFQIGGHTFFRPEPDIRFRGLTDTGFYEILHPGKTMVIARKTKQVQYYPGEDISYAFRTYVSYFVYDNEKFIEVSSQKDLLSIYKDRADEVRKYLRGQKLSFKKNTEETLKRSAKFYDEQIK